MIVTLFYDCFHAMTKVSTVETSAYLYLHVICLGSFVCFRGFM